MNGAHARLDQDKSALSILREALVREDSSVRQVAPLLTHLLTVSDKALFNDRVLATIRGMAEHVAAQLVAFGGGASENQSQARSDERGRAMTAALLKHDAFVRFAHMLIMEMQFLERIERVNGLDPVMPPLLESLCTASDSILAGQARQLIASQMRFMKHVRRMSLPLNELPAELLHDVLALWQDGGGPENEGPPERRMHEVAQSVDEGKGRLALLDRMLFELNGASNTPVRLNDGGGSLFLSDLANRTGAPRNDVVLAMTEDQYARLVLLLKAGSYPRRAVEEQLLVIHPSLKVSRDLIEIATHEAQLLLRSSSMASGPVS